MTELTTEQRTLIDGLGVFIDQALTEFPTPEDVPRHMLEDWFGRFEAVAGESLEPYRSFKRRSFRKMIQIVDLEALIRELRGPDTNGDDSKQPLAGSACQT